MVFCQFSNCDSVRDLFYKMYRYFEQQLHSVHRKFRFKMHTLLDYDYLLPEFVNITDGKSGDNMAVFDIPVPLHSVVVADREYCDFSLLNDWDSNNVFFVVRHKDNLLYSREKEMLLPEKRDLDNLVVSFRLNTFTKKDLEKSLDEPFTSLPNVSILL